MKAVSGGFPFSHAGGTIVGRAEEDSLGLKTIENLVMNLTSMTESAT
jgi:hypothetical protein